MWLLELSENPYVNKIVIFILSGIEHIWFVALISTAVLTALFVIITLAQIEARRKVKSKWFAWTFCSLAILAGLIILKPRGNMEQVQYMPTPSLVQEDAAKQNDTATKASKSTGSTTSQTGAGKSQGTAGNTQGTQKQSKTTPDKNQAQQAGKGTTAQSQGPQTIQDQLASSLQKKNSKDGKVEYRDPVLEEILEQKRQAEEESKESSSEESPAQESDDAGAMIPTDQENIDLEEDNQKGEQQAVKVKILVSSLNVRDKGGFDGRIIGTLNTGDIVEVIDKNETGEWIRIKLNDGQIGWVLKNYIQILL
ncbi:SH3 domain-containing protein [Pelotomaculum propionicicum]|uniref:Uncharacterized protein n=1 Tax=Pelotomaculum propionicicum TaxID=258475 RepID=A0A4Y7RL53_9FIRM|nr:SH3 domain-containing protein [Pelotomaculum propionicicum]TEB09469.1 hypothetical protein Pmgp_03126 [Pelotomaculum propionicicum]